MCSREGLWDVRGSGAILRSLFRGLFLWNMCRLLCKLRRLGGTCLRSRMPAPSSLSPDSDVCSRPFGDDVTGAPVAKVMDEIVKEPLASGLYDNDSSTMPSMARS